MNEETENMPEIHPSHRESIGARVQLIFDYGTVVEYDPKTDSLIIRKDSGQLVAYFYNWIYPSTSHQLPRFIAG